MDYWHKQTTDKPLYEDLLWSRPENKRSRGKLAIFGGNSFGFSVVAEAYQASIIAGIGTARVLLPDSVRKVVGSLMTEGEFAPSNPSGSFSQKALGDFLDLSSWSDASLLAGELGRNSETAILLEKFVSKYSGPLIITKDAVDYFTSNPEILLDRPQTTLVLTMAQLQKIFRNLKSEHVIKFDMDLHKLVEALHEFSSSSKVNLIVKHLENIVVTSGGLVSTTRLGSDLPIWRVQYASKASVWLIQNPNKQFEALTTSVIQTPN